MADGRHLEKIEKWPYLGNGKYNILSTEASFYIYDGLLAEINVHLFQSAACHKC